MSDISDSDLNSSEGLEYASEGLEYASEPEGSLFGSSGTTPAASTKRCASPKGGRNSKWSHSESSTPDSRVIASTKETPSRTPKPVHQVRRHIRVTSQEQQHNPQICGTEVLAALGEVTTTTQLASLWIVWAWPDPLPIRVWGKRGVQLVWRCRPFTFLYVGAGGRKGSGDSSINELSRLRNNHYFEYE